MDEIKDIPKNINNKLKNKWSSKLILIAQK
jgi:hypothetical protein